MSNASLAGHVTAALQGRVTTRKRDDRCARPAIRRLWKNATPAKPSSSTRLCGLWGRDTTQSASPAWPAAARLAVTPLPWTTTTRLFAFRIFTGGLLLSAESARSPLSRGTGGTPTRSSAWGEASTRIAIGARSARSCCPWNPQRTGVTRSAATSFAEPATPGRPGALLLRRRMLMALGNGPRRASLVVWLPPLLVLSVMFFFLGEWVRHREQHFPCELDLAPFHQTKDAPHPPPQPSAYVCRLGAVLCSPC